MRLTESQYQALVDQRPGKPAKAPKYGNVRTKGFDSKKEEARYQQLRALLAVGEIAKLECQPEFVWHTLAPWGELINCGRYRADFRYVVTATGETKIEDVKGGRVTRTEAYRLRKRAVEAEYGISITEV